MNTATDDVTVVTCADGTYAVNERLLRRIITSYYRAQANWNFRKEEPVDTGWFGPELKVPAVDWRQARTWTDRQTDSELYGNWLQSLPRMGPRIAKLNYMQSQTTALQSQFRDWSKSLQQTNSAAIEQRADQWGMAADAATTVRDTSAGILTVGAMVIPAGAAAVGVGLAATGIKATAKFQDTNGQLGRRVGAAMVQVSGDLIFTMIPLMKAGAVMRGAKGAEKATLVVLETLWDSQVSLIEGKELGDILQSGAMTLLWKGAGAKLGIEKSLTQRMTKWLLPGAIKVVGHKKAGTRMAKAVAGAAVGTANDKIKGLANSGVTRMREGPSSGLTDAVLATHVPGEGLQRAAMINRDMIRLAVQRLK